MSSHSIPLAYVRGAALDTHVCSSPYELGVWFEGVCDRLACDRVRAENAKRAEEAQRKVDYSVN